MTTADVKAQGDEPEGSLVAGGPAVIWPDIAVTVRYGWLVPRWIATSHDPQAGAVRGWGLTRAGAARSISRRMPRA